MSRGTRRIVSSHSWMRVDGQVVSNRGMLPPLKMWRLEKSASGCLIMSYQRAAVNTVWMDGEKILNLPPAPLPPCIMDCKTTFFLCHSLSGLQNIPLAQNAQGSQGDRLADLVRRKPSIKQEGSVQCCVSITCWQSALERSSGTFLWNGEEGRREKKPFIFKHFPVFLQDIWFSHFPSLTSVLSKISLSVDPPPHTHTI